MSARRCRAVVGTEDEASEYQRRNTRRQRHERDGWVAERFRPAGEHRAELLNGARRFIDQEQPPGAVVVARCHLRFDDFERLRPDLEYFAIPDFAVAAGI